MHRRTAVIDDKAFAAIDALLDDGFCICAVVTDDAGRATDYRFLRVNRHFEAMTGLKDAEGRTALELVPGLERSWVDAYARVGLGRETLRFTDGSVPMGRAFEVFAGPIDPPGCFAIIFRDVTAIRRLEEEREQALDSARHLLKELNHRVMNSFAAIGAITAMETRAASAEARPALERLQGRVQALGALYRRLDGATAVDRIEVGEYLGGNVAALRDSLAADARVDVSADIAPLSLPTRAAVPLGLIVNELLTNAIRHAVPGGGGRVHVAFGEADGTCRLTVADDGPGLGPGFGGAELGDAELGRATGAGGRGDIGRGLVQALAGDLGGAVAVESTPAGTTVSVTFPLAA